MFIVSKAISFVDFVYWLGLLEGVFLCSFFGCSGLHSLYIPCILSTLFGVALF